MNALVDPDMLRDAKPMLVTVIGPIAGDAEEYELPREMTVAEAIAERDLTFRLPTIAVISSAVQEPEPILRGYWHVRKVRAGETLTFVSVPRGGGDSTKRIVGIIASLAMAVAAPFVGAAAAGAFGLTQGTAAFTAVAGIASAAFMAGGSLLLSTLLRPTPKPSSEAEQVYMAQASGNRAMPLEPIPCPYGMIRFPPPYASRPYFEFSGNDQYLYQLHCWGVGHSEILRWEISDTLVWSSTGGFTSAFQDVEMQIIHPGDEIKLFPANVTVSENVSGQTVPSPPNMLGPFAVNPAGTLIEEIALDFVFPSGLFQSKKDGSNGNASRILIAEYRPIDDLGQPLTGSWTTLFSQTYTRATRTPQRFTRRADVPAGRYEVRFHAGDRDTSEDEGQEPSINRVTWVGLRGYLKDFVTPEGVTLIATKIRANEQVAGSASGQYFFTGQRHLPVYDIFDEEWKLEPTRNPAWAAADALRNTDYGLGLPDGQIDVNWLIQYADVWDNRNDRFDGVFDRQWVALEAVNAILEVGRSQIVRLGGRIGFVRDEPKHIRRHVFTPRNIVRDSIERTDIWFDETMPDHVRARFLNNETWQEETIDCVISAIGSADAQEMEMFGIIERDHAWREGIYRAADNAYRRSFRKFTVEAEGRLLVRGDPIALHDPLGSQKGIQIAAIESLDPSLAAPKITLDRDIEVPDADEIYVTIRDRYGKEWGPCLVNSIAGRVINLNATNRLAIEAQTGYGLLENAVPGDRSELAHISILADQTRLWNGLLVSAEPNGRLYDIVCVNDDQRVHTADQTQIIPAPYTPPDIFNPSPTAPTLVGLYASAKLATHHVELEAGWQPAPGAVRYIAEISYDENAHLSPNDASWTPVHDSAATRFTIPINPQTVTVRAAAIGTLTGPWAYAVVSAIPELALPPDAAEAIKDYQAITGANFREIQRRFEELDLRIADQEFGNAFERQEIRHQITASYETSKAQWSQDIRMVVTLSESIVQSVESLEASVFNEETGLPSVASAVSSLVAYAGEGGALAQAFGQLSAASDPNDITTMNWFAEVTSQPGGINRWQVSIRAGGEGNFRSAGFGVDLPADPGGQSLFWADAQRFLFVDLSSGSSVNALVYEGGVWKLKHVKIGSLNFEQLTSDNGKLIIRGAGNDAYIELTT